MKKSSLPQEFKLTPEMVGIRLDRAIANIEGVFSRSRAEALIELGLVLINGQPAKSSYKIRAQDRLEISFPDPIASQIVPLDLPLDILFEDSDLLVVNKPSGLVVHPAAGHSQDTLVNALVAHTNDLAMKFGEDRPGIVHRLDKDTSGLLVVAKNDFTQEHLSSQFKDRTIHRLYQAITLGVPPKRQGTICSFLSRHLTDRQRYSSITGSDRKIIRDPQQNPGYGKWAVTHYKVLSSHPSGFALLQLKLETGRTHQIRVHLSESGCPILGDETYGAGRKIKSLHGTSNQALALSASRTALHAAELGFIHPRHLTPLSFAVPWPDMENIRSSLFPGVE